MIKIQFSLCKFVLEFNIYIILVKTSLDCG